MLAVNGRHFSSRNFPGDALNGQVGLTFVISTFCRISSLWESWDLLCPYYEAPEHPSDTHAGVEGEPLTMCINRIFYCLYLVALTFGALRTLEASQFLETLRASQFLETLSSSHMSTLFTCQLTAVNSMCHPKIHTLKL